MKSTLTLGSAVRLLLFGKVGYELALTTRRVQLMVDGVSITKWWGGFLREPGSWREFAIVWGWQAWNLALAIAFAAWLRRVYLALPVYGVQPRHKAHWAWAGFLVPVAWWVIPYQMVREVWRQTAGPDEDTAHGFILAWWMAFHGQLVATFVLAGIGLASMAWLAQTVIGWVLTLLALKVVRRVSERVEHEPPVSIDTTAPSERPLSLRSSSRRTSAYRGASGKRTLELSSAGIRTDIRAGAGLAVLAATVVFSLVGFSVWLPIRWWGAVVCGGGAAVAIWAWRTARRSPDQWLQISDVAWRTERGAIPRDEIVGVAIARRWADPTCVIPRYSVSALHEDDSETELFVGLNRPEAASIDAALTRQLETASTDLLAQTGAGA